MTYALGALYILNIYYRDDVLEYGTINLPNNLFDNRLGSDIFAATFADASSVPIGEDDSDTAINDVERNKLDSALCIIKYTDDAWRNMHEEFIKYNNDVIIGITKMPEFVQKLRERCGKNTVDVANVAISLIKELQIDYIRKNPPRNFTKAILNGNKEVILNKGQVIYKVNIKQNKE